MFRSRMTGNLTFILLTVIDSASDKPLYGLEIARKIRSLSGGEIDLAAANLYPPLHRLQKDELVEVEMQLSPHGSGRVGYYTLTERGRQALERERAETEAFIKLLEVFVPSGGVGRPGAPQASHDLQTGGRP